MKRLLILMSLLTINSVMARSLEECASFVEERLENYAICSSHDEHVNDSYYFYRVEGCKKIDSGVSCEVTQDWLNSGCSQEIYLDKNCNYNTGAKITRDDRED